MDVPPLIAGAWTLSGALDFPPTDASVEPVDFRQRVEAAARAGYSGIGLGRFNLIQAQARFGFPDMRRILDDNGITLVELEAVSRWCAPPDPRADAITDDILRGAGELRAAHVKAIGNLDGAPWPREAAQARYMELAQRFFDAGSRLGLEMIPGTNIDTLDDALFISGPAADIGGGLLLDAWHVTRTDTPYARLRTLSADQIICADLSDGDAVAHPDVFTEQTQHRRLCGEGAFELPAFIEAIAATGFAGPFAVEIVSNVHRARDLDDAARRSFDTAAAQFAAVPARPAAPATQPPMEKPA